MNYICLTFYEIFLIIDKITSLINLHAIRVRCLFSKGVIVLNFVEFTFIFNFFKKENVID